MREAAGSSPATPTTKAPWPSGKAEPCKGFTPGSNPGGASKICFKIEGRLRNSWLFNDCRVPKCTQRSYKAKRSANRPNLGINLPEWRNGRRTGLKIPGAKVRAGSSPASGTMNNPVKMKIFTGLFN